MAVMEYCDKSLYNALTEPENRYGLPEDEYMRFFRHIGTFIFIIMLIAGRDRQTKSYTCNYILQHYERLYTLR